MTKWDGKCTLCGEKKGAAAFAANRRQCKECLREKAGSSYYDDIESSHLQSRVYQQKNKLSAAMRRYGYKKGHEVMCPHCKGIIKA